MADRLLEKRFLKLNVTRLKQSALRAHVDTNLSYQLY